MRLYERLNICDGAVIVDLLVAGMSGDWVSMANYGTAGILIRKHAGTAGEDITVTVQQAQDNGGTGVKALVFKHFAKKQAATNLFGVTTWTIGTSTGSTWTTTDNGEEELLLLIEVDAEDLDTDNGFDFMRATISDPGATASQYASMMYLLADPRFPQPSQVSALS